MNVCRLIWTVVPAIILSGCAQLMAYNPNNHYYCTVVNLTSSRQFTSYAPSQQQAQNSATERCVAASEYGWRCQKTLCALRS